MSAALSPGEVFASVYRIERLLASGGMGVVYVAEHMPTGRRRALKLMLPSLMGSATAHERFVLEAKVGSEIPSEHVIEVTDAGYDTVSGSAWLAMELLEGESLADRVERLGPLPDAAAFELLAQLGHALGAAHRRGIVHRDLKPDNVFIAKSDRRGLPFTVKVLDFGIAKLLEEGKRAGVMTEPIGTPMWLAPEQAEERGEVGPGTDVWALGLIAFYALVGQPFWKSARDGRPRIGALLAELLLEPIPAASRRAAELGYEGTVPAGFDAWFARCVLRERSERWPDAAEAIAALGPPNLQPIERISLASGARHSAKSRSVARTVPLPDDERPTPRTSTAPSWRLVGGLLLGSTFGSLLFGAACHSCATPLPPPPAPLVLTVFADAGPPPPPPPEPERFDWPPRVRHRWFGTVTYPNTYTYSFEMFVTRGATDGASGNFRITVLRTREGAPPAWGVFVRSEPIGLSGLYAAGHLSLTTDEMDPTAVEIEVAPDGDVVGRVGGDGRLIGWLSEPAE